MNKPREFKKKVYSCGGCPGCRPIPETEGYYCAGRAGFTETYCGFKLHHAMLHEIHPKCPLKKEKE